MRKSGKTGRDLDAVADGLDRWFARGHKPTGISKILSISTVATGGLSNDTFIIDALKSDGASIQYVLRAPPLDSGVFPDYDLRLQGVLQERLGAVGIPVAAPIAYESGAEWIGSQFLLMPMINGRSPADWPCYIDEGWVRDLDPSSQMKMVYNFLYWTARINNLDIEATGLKIAARSTPGATPLAQEFAWWKNYIAWVARGEPNDDLVDVVKVVDWCERHWPDGEPEAGFVWGDARPQNVLYAEDLTILGVLDFETAALGPAEFDLGWWLTYRQNLMSTRGGALPELPGYPDRQESISIFEGHLGRKVRDLAWHEMFASVRQGAIVAAIRVMWRKRGLGDVPIISGLPEWQLKTMRESARIRS